MPLSALFSRIFWITAAAAAVFSLFNVISTGMFLSGYVRTEGTVSAIREVRNAIPFTEEDSGIFRYPDVSFIDTEGNSILIQSPAPRNDLEVGDAIPILYKPDDSRQARIDGIWELWGGSLIFGGLACIFAVFGLASRLGAKKTAKADGGSGGF